MGFEQQNEMSKSESQDVLNSNFDQFKNLIIESSLTLLNINENEKVISKIGELLYQISKDHVVIMYSNDSLKNSLSVNSTFGISSFQINRINEELSFNPLSANIELSTDLIDIANQKSFVLANNSCINHLFNSNLFTELLTFKNIVGFSDVYIAGLQFNDHIYGLAVILQTAEVELQNIDLVETLIIQSLAVLDRNRYVVRLNENETKFNTIFNETPIPEILFDKFGNFLKINNAGKTLFGDPIVDLNSDINLFNNQVFSKEVVTNLKAGNSEYFKLKVDKESFFSRYFTSSSDTEKIIEATIKSYGEFGILFQAKDVTTNIQILDELVNNKENLLLLADNIPVMLAYIDSNLDYIFVNQKYADWLKITRENIIGRSVKEIISSQMYDSVFSRIQKVLSGESLNFEYTNFDNGRKQILSISYVPHISEQGIVTSYFALLQDITSVKKNEEKIRESEQRYDAIFYRSYDCIYVHDLFGNFIDANDSMFKLLGYNKKEFLNINFNSLLSPNQIKNAVRVTQEILITGAQKEIVEFIWKTKSGESKTVETIASLIYKDGEPYAIQGVARDITERKRIHEALMDSEQRIRKIIENTHAGYFRINTDGYFEFVNDAWLKMHKYDTPEEVIGKHFTFTQVDYHINLARKLVKDVMDGRTTTTGDFTRLCKDGSIGFHTYSLNAVTYNNETIGIEGFIIDTTEQRKAQTDYKILFNSMQDGFALHEIICNQQGKPINYRFLDVNPAFEKLTGFKADELIGKTVLEVMPGTEQSWIDEYGKIALYGDSISFENYASELDKYFEITAFSPRKNQFGVICNDITDRKRVESELQKAKEIAEEANRLNSIILGNLGHELRTPLNGALGFSQLLKLELTDPEQLEMVAMIHQSMKRLEKTLNSLLTLTELEFGRLKLAICSQHLSSILKMIYNSFEEMVKERYLDFHLILNDKTIYSPIDETLINIIMFNLIDNALKFTNEGHITIELSAITINNNPFAEIKIIDTGSGIKKENLDKIFEPFRQESEGLNRIREGLGIGLTITQKMVEIMQGTIHIESQLNKGTTVALRFPRII